MPSSGPAEELRTICREAAAVLRTWDDARAGEELAPGKWSPKQVLGHMIDSASVNRPEP